jgi:hypothetical protein
MSSNLIVRTYLKRDKPPVYKQAEDPSYANSIGDQAEYRQRMRILGAGIHSRQRRNAELIPAKSWLLMIGILALGVGCWPSIETGIPPAHQARPVEPGQNLYFVADQGTGDWDALRSPTSHPSSTAPSASATRGFAQSSRSIPAMRLPGSGADQLSIPGSRDRSNFCLWFSFTYPFAPERVGRLFCVRLPGSRSEQLEDNMESVVRHLQDPKAETLCTYGATGTRCQ